MYVNGVRYLEKPPLPYWLVAVNYHVFGYNVFATHLPTASSAARCWRGYGRGVHTGSGPPSTRRSAC